MDTSGLLNVALTCVLLASYGARHLPRYRAHERRRHELIILHRLKACGRTPEDELEALCHASAIEPLLREMEREDLVRAFVNQTERVPGLEDPPVYYVITARGERYLEENGGLATARRASAATATIS